MPLPESTTPATTREATQELSELNHLLLEFFELADEDRSRWLEALAIRLPEHHGRLLRMLNGAKTRDAQFLERSLDVEQVASKLSEASDDEEGDTIGSYRLIRKIGSGGMGTVWLAERSDGAINRRVALKLPSVGWSRALIERTRRERDILASLEHPHIARLYDGGVTPEGRPYLIMEYVDGRAIDIYCNDNHLDVVGRVKLFLQVCDAVAYAHSRLVVHRDLKPSNMLVAPNGDVRLLDFGIAKLIEAEQNADIPGVALGAINPELSDGQATRIVGRAHTPDYASPEQIGNEPIGVASDVYSLGIVLFELLAGKRPYRLRRASGVAFEEAIIEGDLPLASSIAPRERVKALRGDLDAILSKAMRRHAVDRYSSVDAFATDLTHYLTGEPVRARRISGLYLAKKFVARHRLGVLGTLGFFVALCVALVTATWQANVARAEAARADAVKRFVSSIFSESVPREGVGGAVLASDLLVSASERIENELDDRPMVAAELGAIVGTSLVALGEMRRAEAPLRAAVARSATQFGRTHPIALQARSALADSILDFREDEALEINTALIDDAARDLERNARIAVAALRRQSFILARKNRTEASYEALTLAITYAERYLGEDSESTVDCLLLLGTRMGVLATCPIKCFSRAKLTKERAALLGPSVRIAS